jgi:hypothetical protein
VEFGEETRINFPFFLRYDNRDFVTGTRIQEGDMVAYTPEIERMMKRLFDSLRENDRRRYAAIEATKLGHGGVEYIARVLGCDPKTIRQGQAELNEEDDLDTERVRKKGVAANG